VRQIFPVAGPELELIPAADAGPLPAAISQLAALYRNGAVHRSAGRPWLRANMISSADGAATLGGRSGPLGGPADRMIFLVLRSMADVILVGAGTARTERYRPVSPSALWAGLRAGQAPAPVIAVVTARLDLDSCPDLFDPTGGQPQTIVITTASAVAGRGTSVARRARVLVAGQDRVDVRQAVAALAGLGYRQILTEGGPHLLGQLAEAALVDELCLTISPALAAGPGGRIVTSPASGSGSGSGPVTTMELAHVLTDAGFLLSRYVRPAS
jgi:riboflavin biosynthesis pyrimidine reductase